MNRDEPTHPRALLLGLFLVGIGLSGMCSAPHPAHGQAVDRDDEERRAQLHLADTVSRVCAHESSLMHMADCFLVWQATRRHGDTAAERTAWLFVHSPCALRGVRCGHGRHQHDPGHWSSTLPTSGEDRPENWPAVLEWSEWAPRWTRIRRTVRHLMRGEIPAGGWPCPEDPDSWAGRVVDGEHVRRHAEHLRALDCRDRLTGEPTRNEGFRWI